MTLRTASIMIMFLAFLGTKVFLLFSRKTGIGMAIVGAGMLILSEAQNAGAQSECANLNKKQ